MHARRAVLSLILDALVAFGTLVLAFVALYGEWLKAKLLPPMLHLELVDPAGQLTVFASGVPVVYYHLKVVNERRWMTVKNCRVMLVGVTWRGPDQQFIRPETMPVPFQFVWAPAGVTPTLATVHKEATLDFGRLVSAIADLQQPARFEPTLYVYPNDFRRYIGTNEAVQYSLQIEADGYSTDRHTVVQVAWDGKWSTNPDERIKSLVVTIIR